MMTKFGFGFAASLALVALTAACGDDSGAGGAGSGVSSSSSSGTGTGTGSGSSSSSSSSSGSGGEGSAFATYCNERADLACSGGDFDRAACARQEECALHLLRDDAEEPLFACLTRPECPNEDACIEELRATIQPTPAGEEMGEACRNAAMVECDEQFLDYCTLGYLFDDSVLTTLTDCFDKPTCAEISTCVQGVDEMLNQCEDWL